LRREEQSQLHEDTGTNVSVEADAKPISREIDLGCYGFCDQPDLIPCLEAAQDMFLIEASFTTAMIQDSAPLSQRRVPNICT
jgi:hypothetical protein